MVRADLEIEDTVYLIGHPSIRGRVTALDESDGVQYAKFQCEVHKRETGWLRFGQLREGTP